MDRVKAKYIIRLFGNNHGIAANYTCNWPAELIGGTITLNPPNDNGKLLFATVLEITHSKFGKLLGLFPLSFSFILVLPDFTQIKVHDEDNAGLIYGQSTYLEPMELDLLLWKPTLTGLPYCNAYAGLTQEEMGFVRTTRRSRLADKLQIIEC